MLILSVDKETTEVILKTLNSFNGKINKVENEKARVRLRYMISELISQVKEEERKTGDFQNIVSEAKESHLEDSIFKYTTY